MRLVLLTLCACICLLGAGSLLLLAATPDPLQKYHLANGDVPKLARVEESHLYGKGNEMTKIYDGGINMYLDAGVVEASLFYYKRDTVSAEMVILHLQSAAHAQKFYAKWKKDMGPKFTAVKLPKSKIPAYAITYVQDGMTYGYACTKDYMITTSLDAKDAKLAAAMLTASIAKMRK